MLRRRDAWEMGVTTPSSWMYAWEAYRNQVDTDVKAMDLDESDKTLLQSILKDGCDLLGLRAENGRDFKLRPVRL